MEITSSKQESDTVITLKGDLDISSAEKVETFLISTMAQDSARLVVDISGVPFADSSGLGGLVAVYKKANEMNHEIVLRNPSPILKEILTITRMNRFFKIQE